MGFPNFFSDTNFTINNRKWNIKKKLENLNFGETIGAPTISPGLFKAGMIVGGPLVSRSWYFKIYFMMKTLLLLIENRKSKKKLKIPTLVKLMGLPQSHYYSLYSEIIAACP